MKDIAKSIPILSGVLIFIGYVNYLTFYQVFDIEISTYLSTSELILSFLPLTFPILIIIGLLSFHAIGAVVILSFKNKGHRDDDDEDSFNIYAFKEILLRIIKNVREHQYKKWNILWLLLDIIGLIIGALVVLFFVLYIFILVRMIFSNSLIDKIPSVLMIVFAVFWVLLFVDVVNRADKFNSIQSPFYIKLIFTSALFIALICIFNKEKAHKILNGKPQFEVKLFTKTNDTIATDTNLVFVGKTNNYLFLREFKDKRNLIYKMDNIDKIELTKNIN